MTDQAMGSAQSAPAAVVHMKSPPASSDETGAPSLVDETRVLVALAESYDETWKILAAQADRGATDSSSSARLVAVRADLKRSLLRLARLPVTTFTEAALVLSAAERYYHLEGERRVEDAFARHLVTDLLRLIMSLKVDGQIGGTARRPLFNWFGLTRDRGN